MTVTSRKTMKLWAWRVCHLFSRPITLFLGYVYLAFREKTGHDAYILLYMSSPTDFQEKCLQTLT